MFCCLKYLPPLHYLHCVLCEAHHCMASKGLEDREESVALLLVGLAVFCSPIPKKSCIPSCPGKLGTKDPAASPGLQGAPVTRTGHAFVVYEP